MCQLSIDGVTIVSGRGFAFAFVFVYLFLKHSLHVEQMADDKKQFGFAKRKA